MKKLLLISTAVLGLTVAHGQTMRSGEIGYKCLGGYTYEFTAITYTKGSSFAGDNCSVEFIFGTGDSAEVCRNNYEVGDPAIDFWGASCSGDSLCHHMGEWTLFNPCIDTKKNVYKIIYTFPGAGNYIISVCELGRVSNIVNIPANPPTMFCLIDTLVINPFIAPCNSTPVFLNSILVDTLQPSINYIFNSGATDPDGDSLAYKLTPCLDGTIPIAGYFIPSGVSLNAVTGDFIWNSPPTPSSSFDLYNFTMIIEEWRKISNQYTKINSGMREMELFVGLCAGNGVTDFSKTNSINIFPNPFCTQTTLQTDNPLHNATLTVYNCFGQTVAQIKNISGQTITFNRGNLPSGLYFVRLTEDNETFAIEKLIITDQ